MKSNIKSLLDRAFKDKNGHVVLAQWPNAPLAIWILLDLAASFAHQARISTGLHNTATAFLSIWAYLEIRHGVNYFRVGLGIIVGLMIIASFFNA